jgi:hypothetical protein
MAAAAHSVGTVATARRFRIALRNCRGCGREWPAHRETCSECAAVLGEVRLVECARLVPPGTSSPLAPTFAAVLAIELSRRAAGNADRWAAAAWATLAPRLAGAVGVWQAPAGSILVVWPLEASDSLAEAAELSLTLLDTAARLGGEGGEARCGIAAGVVDGRARSDATRRCAERLALAAAPAQVLVCEEVARRLADRFELRPVGVVARWPMPLLEGNRALVGRLTPPALPSAICGEVPELVLGRGRERRRLLAELATAAAGRRRVLVVTAPAGGGKSYLLRRVLADAETKLAAGVAFSPLGSRPLDPLRALLAELSEAGTDNRAGADLAAELAAAATRRARLEPSMVVIDDVHWASRDAVAVLSDAIARSATDVPLAWVVAARSAALPALESLVEAADARVELPPLVPIDRTRLLAHRLGRVPGGIRAYVAEEPERGNPLYLEHLAEAIQEGGADHRLPGTLHEAVLARLEHLVGQARRVAHWAGGINVSASQDLEALERELGDWLDRLETTDIADLATIGRYLARLRAVDAELVIARSLLRMPVASNRRLAWAVERLAAASTAALLDYLDTVARDSGETQATYEARAAAERAERALRLSDAERLLAFAAGRHPEPELARKRGDLALALGRAEDAQAAYEAASRGGDRSPELQRRLARANALLGDVATASARLAALARLTDGEPRTAYAASLDLARLCGQPPPAANRSPSADLTRRAARIRAWARLDDVEATREALAELVLVGEPAACAAELIEGAAISRFAALDVIGLEDAARQALEALGNPHAAALLDAVDVEEARRMFLHWEV